MQPTSGTVSFVITNTIVSNNGFTGIYYFRQAAQCATANGVIDHVVATNNEFGIAIILTVRRTDDIRHIKQHQLVTMSSA